MHSDILRIARLRPGCDGKGICTLVLFFGCPLRCKYCINNYCHEDYTEEAYAEPRADYTAEELVKILSKDSLYFEMSGGGVTFGGGEPLLQAEFIKEVCDIAPKAWKLRIETSLNVPWEKVELLIDFINLWIIDIKDSDPQIYRRYTQCDNAQVFDNLDMLISRVGREKIHIRVPHIPHYQKKNSVAKTVALIKKRYGIIPEVFDYII